MGQQYQQAVRARRGIDAQQIVESQRAWLLQRNTNCNGVADTAVWGCLLEMTKQRIAVLAKMSSIEVQETSLVKSPALGQISPTSQASVALSAPTNDPNPVASKSSETSSPASEGGSNSLLVAIFSIIAIGAVIIFNSMRRKERLEAERQRLIAKYGLVAADRILAKHIWQGMTEEQLIESWGMPVDKDTEIKRSKIKETWKYGQTGRNRFSNRVYVENGIVIGWKQ